MQSSDSHVGKRLQHLEGMRRRWVLEAEILMHVDPQRASEIIEAVSDLGVIIQRLEVATTRQAVEFVGRSAVAAKVSVSIQR